MTHFRAGVRRLGVLVALLLVAAAASLLAGEPEGKKPARAPVYPFVFKDVGGEAGLFPAVAGIRGHGAAWGDADGDGWIDLYVATFHTDGSKANLFFRNDKGKFFPDGQKALGVSTRGTGVVFADLDNDGDLDLYVAGMPQPRNDLTGCTLFRNDGGGKFTDVSKGNGACPAAFGGRGATVLDFDGDGLLDLLVGEDPLPGYNGSKTKSSRLFRNMGGLRFEDVSRAAGLPEGVPGLGVATADVNNDGWPDFFLASSGGGNVLFLNDGRGKFREAPGSREVFAWKGAGGDNMVCGVCFADVNRDGLLDLVLGQHYQSPWKSPVANRLYLNRRVKDGVPTFEDVTEKVGLAPLGMKSPHVEVQDFDNDGWPDVYASVVKFADGKPYPVIFRHQGVTDGLPRFREDAWAVNDFPTAEDKAVQRTGQLFDKILREKKVIYMAPGPSGDFDNDGRLDLFLPNWWVEGRSLLLRNETPGGHWLRVRVEGGDGVNRMGVGSEVKVYAAGKLGDASALLGCRDIATGYGYASGQPAYAHFGLGKEERADVEVILPHGKGTLTRGGVKANQLLRVALAADLPAADPPPKKGGKKKGTAEITYPPALPGGRGVATDTSDAFLKPPGTLREGVAVAREVPTIDFLYFPGQTYPGKPWSNWGDSLAANGKYYASIGDHLAPAGNAFVYEYDPAAKTFRLLADLREVLNLPDGHYTPGKIHGRLDRGEDGWLYFSTHRGSTTVTNDQYHYKGDWIVRVNPESAKAEVVAQGPVPKHCIPNSVLDPKRLIFYGGTAPGGRGEDVQFFAYDVKKRKLLYSGPDGPSRYMIFAGSTGRVYYTQGKKGDEGPLMRFDPDTGKPEKLDGKIGVRAATRETPQGIVYTVSSGQGGREATLYAFDTRTEKVQELGPAAVGRQQYVATLDADPTGRYVYYMPGAHGGSETDGSPVVQFDTKTRTKKVIAFLHPFYRDKYGCTPKGTYSAAVDPKGDKLYVTWNASRGSRAWDCCALTVIHIPEAERRVE